MDNQILTYIQNNKESMGKNDFDTFIESDDFNDMDDESKRIIFYMESFIMSTKDYKIFSEIINDFTKIIVFIKDNEYLQNTHESYETLICNYLQKIRELLSKNDLLENENEFIQNLSKFKDEITKLYFPNNDKYNIINNLNKVVKQLDNIKDDISKENINKFERYSKELNKYINSIENTNIVKQDQDNKKNKEDFVDNKNININNNNYNKNQKNNLYKHSNINDEQNNNNNNNHIYNNNNFNYNNKDNYYEIIYNNAMRNNNINNPCAPNLYDSMIIMNPQINSNQNNDINYNNSSKYESDEDETEEEELLQAKYEEVDNFIDDIMPIFDSNNYNQEKINNLKKQLLQKEEINEDKMNNNQLSNSINSINSINSNISNASTKKKKKSKKESINQNQNYNLNNNVPYKPFMQPNMEKMVIPYPYLIQQGGIMNPYYQQISNFNSRKPINSSNSSKHMMNNINNFGYQNQMYPMYINNNYMQNPNFQMNKKNKKK